MGRPRTDIKPRVLQAARTRFLADGVDGASLRTIAKDAKTNIGMVFYYYPTKDALFFDVIEQVYIKLVADLEATLGGNELALRERIRRLYVRIGTASPEEIDVVRLIVREALVSSPRLGLLLARFQRGHISLVAAALAEGTRTGEVNDAIPLPLALIATFAMGGIPQLARRIAADTKPFSALPGAEALAEAAVGVLFDGLGPKKKTLKAQRPSSKVKTTAAKRSKGRLAR